jgi:chaperonin cofactor prefoldin
LVVGSGSGNEGITIVTGTSNTGGINFADGTSGDAAYRGQFEYRHDLDAFIFATAATERMRIDSSGEVHVNKTASINSGQFEVLAQADHQAIVAKVQTNVNSMFQGFNSSGSAVFVATGAGNLTITGTLYQGSDITLKENIKPLNNQLEIVKKLNPVTFDWKEDKKPYQQIGFIAQEVEKHLPELIEDKDDIKRMSYGNMTTVLVKAIQEQQTQIEALQSEINTLKGGD